MWNRNNILKKRLSSWCACTFQAYRDISIYKPSGRALLRLRLPKKPYLTTLPEVKFEETKLALQPKQRENKRILRFVVQYQPSMPNFNSSWINGIKQRPLQSEIYKDPFNTKEGFRLKPETLGWAKLRKSQTTHATHAPHARESCRFIHPTGFVIALLQLIMLILDLELIKFLIRKKKWNFEGSHTN